MLKCKYCGKEFSEKILPLHEERCKEKEKEIDKKPKKKVE